MRRAIEPIAVVIALALALAGCGSGSASSKESASATVPKEEIQAVDAYVVAHLVNGPRRASGVHTVPGQGCYGSGGDSVGRVEIRIDTPSPRCLLISPRQRVVFINLTGADVPAEAKPVSIQLGDYSARVAPREAAFFSAPVGTYLSLGQHHAHVSGAPGVALLVVRPRCMPHGRPGLKPPYSRCF